MSGTARLSYTVIATLPAEGMAREYVAWLLEGHVAQVIAGGAEAGNVVELDSAKPGGPARVMTQYVFPSRAVFDRYVATLAPRLRAEGLARFGPERGVAYERLVGEI